MHRQPQRHRGSLLEVQTLGLLSVPLRKQPASPHEAQRLTGTVKTSHGSPRRSRCRAGSTCLERDCSAWAGDQQASVAWTLAGRADPLGPTPDLLTRPSGSRAQEPVFSRALWAIWHSLNVGFGGMGARSREGRLADPGETSWWLL